MEYNVRVCAAIRCPGNLTVKSRGTCPSATLLHFRNTT